MFNETRIIPKDTVVTLQIFRDWIISRGGTPLLFAGTLLGWYRECDFIYHTHDIDFTLFIEEYYANFAADIRESGFMQLAHRFNRPEDLLEYKVYINDIIPMDIFFLYHNESHSWTGGLNFNEQYKIYYPLINLTCATDFLGYLMYVPCNFLDVIVSEHGKEWMQPIHSSRYYWNVNPKNIELVKIISENKTNEYFVDYTDFDESTATN
ncbi:unnamed protein product [Thelazia callipaeda]|uniref:LicD family protein n=1 Tax=Thelazia callipaeda TaxID=103827 RepID=A0A0N5CLG7_THECL|nr:unnamed protein product [Thelazia callipaeda]